MKTTLFALFVGIVAATGCGDVYFGHQDGGTVASDGGTLGYIECTTDAQCDTARGYTCNLAPALKRLDGSIPAVCTPSCTIDQTICTKFGDVCVMEAGGGRCKPPTGCNSDCGATCASKCGNGHSCSTGLDCSSGFCDQGTCGKRDGLGCGSDGDCKSGRCVSGVCTSGQPGCNAPNLQCGNACVDPATNVNNCGVCGNVCGVNRSCVAGKCIDSCSNGQSLCNGACVNTNTDAANCGSCGKVCAQGQACQNGACVGGGVSCTTNYGNCDGQAANGCEVYLPFDNKNCGACGNVCAQGNSCVDSRCVNNNGAVACDRPFRVILTGTNSTVQAIAYGIIDVAPRGSFSLTPSVNSPNNNILGQECSFAIGALPQGAKCYCLNQLGVQECGPMPGTKVYGCTHNSLGAQVPAP